MAASNTPKKSTTKRSTSAKKKSSARTQSKKNTAGKQSISSGFQTEIILLVLMAAAISSLFYFTPVLKDLSRGWVIILCAVLVSGLMAWRHPIKTQEEELPVDCGEQKEAQPHE